MSSARSMIISLGHELSEQQNKAFELWTWLPSYKAAQAAHGDHAAEYTPSVSEVLTEAAIYIAHGMNPTDEQRAEAGELYECPCGEGHTTSTRGEPEAAAGGPLAQVHGAVHN